MSFRNSIWQVFSCAAALLLSAGCTTDGDSAGAPCPAGSEVNQLYQCLCEGTGNGLAQCQADLTLTNCDCGSQALDYVMMMNAATADPNQPDPMAMVPEMPAPMPAAPPAMMPEVPAVTVDAGMMGVGTGDAGALADSGTGMPTMMPVTPAPMVDEGEQLWPCTSAVDCGVGLDCHATGGFCSMACSTDADCAGVTGGTYTCNATGGDSGGGVCQVTCTAGGTCPAGTTCQMLGAAMACAI